MKRLSLFRPFRFLISILFFLIWAGCAAQHSGLVFETTAMGKTTGSNSRFQLIDDFNGGVSKTRLGTQWKTSGDAKMRIRPERSDAVKYGGSLGFEFDLPPASSISAVAPLNGLDASQTELLVFMLRKADLDKFGGKIEVSLIDLSGHKTTLQIKPKFLKPWVGPTEEWMQVAIPKAQFRNLDFNQLDQFEVTLTSGRNPESGKLVFDEIAFFGKEELIFNSEKDNLAGFPTVDINQAMRSELLQIKDDQKFLLEIARDTWLYFENLIDQDTHLVLDHVRVGSDLGMGSYISPTNEALYWLANIAAYDLSLITKEKAIQNIQTSLDVFEKLQQWKSRFWYNFYDTGTLQITRKYISTVDNGWLAAALIVLRSAFPEEFGQRASKLIKKLDFSEFYDGSNGQLKLGFDEDKGKYAPYHYGLLASEARLTS